MKFPLSGEFLSMLAQAEFDGDTHYQTWAEDEPNADIAKLYGSIESFTI